MKKRTFNIPTTSGIEQRECFRVWLRMGHDKRAFALQVEGGKPRILADFVSGFRLADLSGDMLRKHVAHPAAFTSGVTDWRESAQHWVDEALRQKGRASVLATLNSVPRINEVA